MKKGTKRLLSGIVTLSLGATMLAGCSANTDTTKSQDTTPAPKVVKIVPEKDAKLVVWDAGGPDGQWTKYVASEFTKKTGIPVKYEEVAQVDAPGKIEQNGPSGKGADVFDAPHDHVGDMETSGIVFKNQLDDSYKNRFVDAAVKGTSGKDGFYGFPLSVETYALFYNKDLVKTPATTWNDLFTEGKSFMAANKGKYAFMMQPGNFYFTYSFLSGYDGYVFGNKNGALNPADLGLNKDGGVKSGEFMKKIHDELLPLKNEDITPNLISDMFNKNKLQYTITGPWDIKNFEGAKVNFGVTTLPTLDNGQTPKPFTGVKAFFVSTFSKYPKAATLFAQFATSDDMLLKRYQMTGELTPSKVTLKNEAIQKDQYLSVFAKQLLTAQPMPNIPEMQKVWDPAGKAYQAIWNGLASPKQAMDNATKQIQDAIKSEKK
jgi:arabinogalactan oligomer/maltooligosaccharide transport system substrate-binding protein